MQLHGNPNPTSQNLRTVIPEIFQHTTSFPTNGTYHILGQNSGSVWTWQCGALGKEQDYIAESELTVLQQEHIEGCLSLPHLPALADEFVVFEGEISNKGLLL